MPLIIPSNSISGEFEVANSLRFNSGSTDNLSRTPSGASNSKTFTFSAWVKRSNFGNATIFGAREDANRNFFITFNSDDNFRVKNKIGGTTKTIITNRLFRDVSAWYHIVFQMDTTQATESNRTKIYINGVQETSFSTEEYQTLNNDTAVNLAVEHRIGDDVSDTGFFNGYMAEVCFIDGSQLDPTSFGEFDEDTGIWKPIDVSGLTFGTNGFYLDFEDSSALGNDVSGNDNDFTVNNLTSIDQTTDSCTNNYCTMNPLDNYHFNTVFSDGNLKLTFNQSNYGWNTSTFGLSQGKWYAEIKIVSGNYQTTGIVDRSPTANRQDLSSQSFSSQYGVDGNAYVNGSVSASYSTFTNGDIIGIALDLDNNKLYYSKNGTWQGSSNPSTGTNGLTITDPTSVQNGFYFIAAGDSNLVGNPVSEVNFGNPTFSISSGNSDANGYGNFEYSVPSGYYALNSKNLAEYG